MHNDAALLLVIVFALFFTYESQSQEHKHLSISGLVLDEHNQPIPGVNIFISGTTIGTASDKYGRFRFQISNLSDGQYKLVFRNIAYHTNTYSFQIPVEDNQLELKVYLKEQHILLDSIVVTAESPKYLAKFEEVFLGNTKNGESASILNSHELRFERKKKRLHAETGKTLRIENPRLGYTMYLILDVFSWHLKKDQGKYFFKDIWFVEQSPENERQRETWQQNRLQTYMNSSRQFFNTLNAGNDLQQHGYTITKGEIEKLAFKPLITKEELNALGIEEIKSSVYRDVYLYTLSEKTNYSLHVTYNDSDSIVRTLNEQPILVDNNGNIINTPEVSFSGYWSKQRTADMLPFDYRPPAKTPVN